MRKLAAILAHTREQMTDELSSDLQDVIMEDGQLLSSISKSVRRMSDFIPLKKNETFTVYAASDGDYIVDAEDISAFTDTDTATITNATLTPPRNLTFTLTDADNSITALVITVVGKDARGTAQTEVFNWAGGKVQSGELLFSYITSVTFTTITGAGTGDVFDMGFGAWVHKGLSLPSSGSTVLLDLENCRDDFALPYFANEIMIDTVEYPVNNDPPDYHNIEEFGTNIRIRYDSSITANSTIRIIWSALHELTYSKSTIPAHLEDLLIEGAMAYAYQIMANSKINAVNIGASAPSQLKQTGYTKIQEFENKLREKAGTHSSFDYSAS